MTTMAKIERDDQQQSPQAQPTGERRRSEVCCVLLIVPLPCSGTG
jgi:hypothetical protein